MAEESNDKISVKPPPPPPPSKAASNNAVKPPPPPPPSSLKKKEEAELIQKPLVSPSPSPADTGTLPSEGGDLVQPKAINQSLPVQTGFPAPTQPEIKPIENFSGQLPPVPTDDGLSPSQRDKATTMQTNFDKSIEEAPVTKIYKSLDSAIVKKDELSAKVNEAATVFQEQQGQLANLQEQIQNPNLDETGKSLIAEQYNALLENSNQLAGFIEGSQKEAESYAKKISIINHGLKHYIKPVKDGNAVQIFAQSLYTNSIPKIVQSLGVGVEMLGDLAVKSNPASNLAFGSDDDKWTDNIGDAINEFGKKMEYDVSDEAEESVFEGELTGRKVANLTGQVLGSIGAVIGGSVVGGPAGGVAAGAGLVMGDVYNTAKEKGLSDDEAMMITAPVTIAVGVLERFGVGTVVERLTIPQLVKAIKTPVMKELAGKTITKEAVFEATSKSIKEIGKTLGKGVAKPTLEEGSTEFLQELVGAGAENIFDLAKGEKAYGTEFFSSDTFIKAFQSGLVGMGAGGVIGAATSGATKKNESLYDKVVEAKSDPSVMPRFEKVLENEVSISNMTKEEAENIKNNIAVLQEVDKTIPATIEDNSKRLDAVNIITERNQLEKEIEGKEPALVKPIKEKIEGLNKELEYIANPELKAEEAKEESAKPAAIAAPIITETAKPEAGKEGEIVKTKTDEKAETKDETEVLTEDSAKEADQQKTETEVLPEQGQEVDVDNEVVEASLPLTEKAQSLLENSLEEYNNADEAGKTEMIKIVEDNLAKREGGEMIGFPLNEDSVNAGLEFLNQVKPAVEPVQPEAEIQPPPTTPVTPDAIESEKPETKQRGFEKRTLETAEGDASKETVSRISKENPSYYEVMNKGGAVEKAREKISEKGGFDEYYDTLIEDKTITSELPQRQVERQLALFHYGFELDNATKSGDTVLADKIYKKLTKLEKIISKDATSAGQASAMLSIWKALRPDGTLEFIKRKVSNENKEKLSRVMSDGETLGDKLSEIREVMNKQSEQIANQIADSENLKKEIEKLKVKLSEKSSEKRTATEKGKSIAKKIRSLKSNNFAFSQVVPISAVIDPSLEIVAVAVENGAKLIDAIDAGLKYIKATDWYKGLNDSDKGKFEEKYKSNLISESESVEKEVKSELVELEETVRDIVKKHWSDKSVIGESIAEKLVSKAGLSQSEAESLSKSIINEFNNQINSVAQKEMTKIMGTSMVPFDKETKSLTKKMIEAINMGALDDSFYTGLFSEKFGLMPDLTLEQSQEIKKLAELIQSQEVGSNLYSDAVVKFATYVESVYPVHKWKNRAQTFIGLNYAFMLSGISTHVLNSAVNAFNILQSPFRNLTNLSKWAKAARKSNDIESFFTLSPIGEIMYGPIAAAKGFEYGKTEAGSVLKSGSFGNKYMEQVTGKENFNVPALEQKRFGDNKFKRYRLLGVDVNMYNYAKYVGRALDAADKLAFKTNYEAQIMSIIREKMVDKGLKGKALREAIMDEYLRKNVDINKVNAKLENEVANFERISGEKLTESKKEIRLREIMLDELDLTVEEKSDAETLANSNVFKDKRNGLIGRVGMLISNVANYNTATQLAIKPFIPFTEVIANVTEYMLDGVPIYGQMRANGLSMTGLINKGYKLFGGEGFETSQMGKVGDRVYYEQMGRAWWGTSLTVLAAALFVGTDDDDFLQLTGSMKDESDYAQGSKNTLGPYMLKIGKFTFNYKQFTGLNIPLGLIGNYNDAIRRMPSKDAEERLYLAFGAAATTMTMIKDFSFAEGINELFELVGDILVADEDEGKATKVAKSFTKKYSGFALRPLPQNANILKQIEKYFDPSVYSQKEIKDILAYSVGIHPFLNKPSRDVFGDKVKTYPAEDIFPYTHWLGIKGKDERWKFLSKESAIPSKINNVVVSMYDAKTGKSEARKMEPDEFEAYVTEAGKIFSEKIKVYSKKSEADLAKRREISYDKYGKELEPGDAEKKKRNGVIQDVLTLFKESKEEAKNSLKIKAPETPSSSSKSPFNKNPFSKSFGGKNKFSR